MKGGKFGNHKSIGHQCLFLNGTFAKNEILLQATIFIAENISRGEEQLQQHVHVHTMENLSWLAEC